MQQVKLFKGVENDVSGLEKEVNNWIRQSGARIVSVTGNIAPQSGSAGSVSGSLGGSQFAASDVLLIILYDAAS
ncbi:MAG: hypothetical protein NTW96_21480 [Planctomycetia bacterium]|nr:hypothetical protein [Planctomycetia bacterium]